MGVINQGSSCDNHSSHAAAGVPKYDYDKTCKPMQRALLLKSALPLISSHGFTREALARAALSLPTPHEQPLSDAAVSALFGRGDEARRTLINEWLLQGRMDMRNRASEGKRPLNAVLKERLQWNEPVLQYLPEVRIPCSYFNLKT